MDKTILNSTKKWPYFLGNILVRVRVVYLPHCPLALSLLKDKGVEAFFNPKNEDPQHEKPLNSSVCVCIYIYIRIIYKKRITHNLESKPTYESTFLKRV